MIEALVREPEWLAALNTLPLWKPPEGPMLVIAPHPDDETLGAGGLIASQRALGFDVTVAAVTDGERAYSDWPGLAALRRQEQQNALTRLGVAPGNLVRFGLPDSNVQTHEHRLVEQLAPLLSNDTVVVAPWVGDFHPDHEACGRAAEKAARNAGATLVWYFFWTWHRGGVDLFEELKRRSHLARFPLHAELQRAKAEALLCHRSQLIRESGDPVLPESLLGPAKRPFEVFAIA